MWCKVTGRHEKARERNNKQKHKKDKGFHNNEKKKKKKLYLFSTFQLKMQLKVLHIKREK